MAFYKYAELAKEEQAVRESIVNSDLCEYGINYLDIVLGKINQNDMVVIGADSGMGKSDIAVSIAEHNASRGRKVVFFYLEGGHEEAAKRIKWKYINQEYYNNKGLYPYINLDFTSWKQNKENKYLKIIEDKINEKLGKTLDNLYIHKIEKQMNYDPDKISYYKSRITYSDVYRELSEFFNGFIESGELSFDFDLLIVDHLHFFDLEDGRRTTEAEKLSDLMQIFYEISNINKKPVIIMSHLRKKDRNRGLPDADDFHGTSSIYKKSREAITICPDFNRQPQGNLYPTFFRIVKGGSGARPNYVASLWFNAETRKYEDSFEIHKVNMATGKPYEEVIPEGQYPGWLKKGMTRYVKEESLFFDQEILNESQTAWEE